jgi:scyllo-inositol 2-dehydrogenase (NADP+)
MSNIPISAAVIGYGLGGRVFHAPFISAVPSLQLSAIVQRRGEEAAAAYPNTHIVRSIDELLDDASIQLVIVSTPNPSHFDFAKQSLLAGKHVVVDKPLTATSGEARELIDIAKSKNVHLFPFHNRRWDGDFLTVQQLLGEKKLGRLVTFESHFDRYRPLQRENSWKESGELGNGMLFDLGPHLLDQALALFGMPEAVLGDVREDRDTTEIEDAFDITLYYPRHRVYLRATMLACDPAPRYLIHGTHGSYKKIGVDPQEPTILAGKLPPKLPDDSWLNEPETNWGTITAATDLSKPGNLVTHPVPTLRGDYRGFYSNVADTILGRAAQAVTAEDGYNVIRILELARESSRARQLLPYKL